MKYLQRSNGKLGFQTLSPAEVKVLCGCGHPVIVDGWNVVNPDGWIGNGYVYRGIV